MQWLDEIRQTATLDEAEQLAVRLVQAPFEEVRVKYALVGFDCLAFAGELAETTRLARLARAAQKVAQNRYELESGERRDVVQEVAGWLDQLHCAGRYARAKKHPLGTKLPKLMFTSEVSAETWSQSRDGMLPVLNNVGQLGDLTEIGLAADFHAVGTDLYERLGDERDDAVFAESSRFVATGRLEGLLDALVDKFEEIAAARELVMSRTGEQLPGLELSLVKSAAASGSRQEPPVPEAPKQEPRPEPVVVVETDETAGL